MMRNCKVLLPALLCCVLANAECNWAPYVDLGARSNGYRRGVGATAFVPVRESECSLMFAQGLAGRWWDVWSVQVGGGYRHLVGERFGAGLNGFLDFARTDHRRAYGQFGVGGEFIGPCWAVRVNGYVPFSRRRVVDRQCDTTLVPSGNQLVCATDEQFLREFVYRGFDCEASYGLDVWCGTVWGTAGYFYFEGRGVRDVQGPRLRLEYRLNDLFGWCGAEATIGGEYEYNQVNKSYGSAVVGLRIPLGCPGRAMRCCSQVSVLRQMGDRVRRNEAIFIRSGRGDRSGGGDILLAANGRAVGFYVAAADGSAEAAGTLNDPTSLASARERAEEGDIIFVLGGEGKLNLSETIKLADGQSLLGSGRSHTVPAGRLVAPVTSQLPIVAWQGGSVPMTELAGGTKVAGIQFEGAGAQAIIAGQDVRDVIVERNTFIEGARAVALVNAIRPRIAHNDFLRGNQGIVIEGVEGSAVVEQNYFDKLSGQSLFVLHMGKQAELDVRRNKATESGGFGINSTAGGLQAGLFHNALSDVIGDGLVVERSGSGSGRLELRAMHNELSRVSGRGVHLLAKESPTANEDEPPFVFDIWTNRIDEAGGSGVHVEHCGEVAGLAMEGRIRDNTLKSTGSTTRGDAIRIDGDMWQPGRLVVDVARNQIYGAHGNAVSAVARVRSVGALHVMFDSNRDRESLSHDPAYFVASEGGLTSSSASVNFELQGNASERKGCGIRVLGKGGAVISKQVAWAVSGANSDLVMEQDGAKFGVTDQQPEAPSWPKEESK